MKKKVGKGVLFAVIAAAAVVAMAVGGIAWYMHTLQSGSDFLEGTKINGTDVSGQTPAEAAASMQEAFESGQVVLSEDGKETFRAGLSELGYTLDAEKLEEELTAFLQEEKSDFGTVVQGLQKGNVFSTALPYSVDEKTFDKAVREEALTIPRVKNENAKILYYKEDRTCRIKPEVQGTEVEDAALQDWLRAQIRTVLGSPLGEEAEEAPAGGTGSEETDGSDAAAPSADGNGTEKGAEGSAETSGAAGQTSGADSDAPSTEGNETEKGAEGSAETGSAKAQEEGSTGFDVICEIPDTLYTVPARTADSGSLREKCEILNRYAGESVTYIFGDKTEKLEFSTIMNWLKISKGKVSVREDKVAAYVRKLAEKYETRYMERTFTTTWGSQVTFPPGLNEYGYTILEDQEAAQLAQDILSGESVEREPVYQTLGAWGDPLFLRRSGTDDMAGTYVEVSISAQHMWYYVNGALLLESDVVTGDVTKDQGTATGVFPLAFKESPSILRGGEGKNKYETKVQYWMPFYEGQGLHDASWKTVFGGSEYMGNGSHGCINLPPSVAETLYYNIEPGTAIIIYY